MNHRRPNRLKTHDYALAGQYFVTFCVMDHRCVFGRVRDGQMIRNRHGGIAFDQFHWLSGHYAFVDVDVFVVMPNHVHAIIELWPKGGNRAPLTLSQLVGAYKTRVSTMIRKQGLPSFAWQRSFHDHVISHIHGYQHIVSYIHNNPAEWHRDRFFSNG